MWARGGSEGGLHLHTQGRAARGQLLAYKEARMWSLGYTLGSRCSMNAWKLNLTGCRHQEHTDLKVCLCAPKFPDSLLTTHALLRCAGALRGAGLAGRIGRLVGLPAVSHAGERLGWGMETPVCGPQRNA